ncbi:DNA alkylation repair protein, partial [Ralstonia sp. TCR112]
MISAAFLLVTHAGAIWRIADICEGRLCCTPTRTRGPSLNDQTTVVAQLAESLAGDATAERAEQEKRYLKSDLRFIGASVPAVRRVARSFVADHPALTVEDLKGLVEALWNTDTHELRSVGIAVLELRSDLLRKSDVRWLQALINRSTTWAHVDWLAIKVVGALAARVPAVEADLDEWSAHTNFWVRRSALLASHDRLAAGQGDFEHFER